MNLTQEQILALPAGREIDVLVATKVMGWTLHEKGYYICPDRDYHPTIYTWLPSDEIPSAWEVVEKLISSDSEVAICSLLPNDANPGKADWHVEVSGWKGFDARANTMPLAVCRAALLAVSEVTP